MKDICFFPSSNGNSGSWLGTDMTPQRAEEIARDTAVAVIEVEIHYGYRGTPS